MPVWLIVVIAIGIVGTSPLWLPILVETLLWAWMLILAVVLGVAAVVVYPFAWLFGHLRK